MQTNKTLEPDSELGRKGTALIEAAYEYWKQYQKDVGGPGAVVTLEAADGHFVLFTRGEYKSAILSAAHRECAGEDRLFRPFEMPNVAISQPEDNA